MTPEQLQELSDLADRLLADGLSVDEVQSQIDSKKQEFKSINEGKQAAVPERVANATAVNEQIATGQSMDLGSEDTSLELDKINKINQNFSKDTDGGVTSTNKPLDVNQANDLTDYIGELAPEDSEEEKRLKEIKKRNENIYQGVVREIKERDGEFLNDKKGDDKDWESFQGFTETKDGLLNTLNLQKAKLGISVNSYVNEIKIAAARSMVDLFGIEDAKKGFDIMDQMDYEEQQKFLNNMFDQIPGGIGSAKKSFEAYEKAVEAGNELQKSQVQFDNTIGQAFAQGDFVEGATRAVSAAVISLPFMAQAMIPVVGIPSIVAMEAAAASKEAQRKGDDIDLTLIGYSAVIGASEGLLEIVSKGIGKTMFKNLFGQSKKIAKESLTKMALKLAKDAGLEGLSESATLTINNGAEAIIRGDEKAWDGYLLELIDTFIIGATSGGGPSGLGKGVRIVKDGIQSRKLNKQIDESNYNSLVDAFSNEKEDSGSIKLAETEYSERFLDFDLKSKVKSGEMTIEKSKEIKKNFAKTQGAANRLKPLGLQGDVKIEAVELLKEKARLQSIVDTAKEKAVVDSELSQIEGVNERLREISKDNAALKRGKDVATTEEFAKELGFDLIQDTKIDDLQKIAPKGFNAKTDYGFIQGNKIYLNNSIIGETNEVKTASHELLHGILTKSIMDGEMTKETVEKFVKDSFGQKEFDFISKQMEAMGYDQAYLEKRPDEYLTQLYESDMLGEAGSFEKVARFVESVILKMTGQQFNFTNKNDLGLFLREYKSSVESGTISEKLKDSKFFNKAQDTDITASSLSKKDSDTVNKIYADQGLNEKSEQQILKLLKPTAKGLAQRFRDRPSFDQKLVEDQILTGKRGMLEVIKSYPKYVKDKKAAGETVAPLSGYINNSFSTKTGFKRYIDNAETIVTKEFTQDISTARGVTDTTTEKTTEKKTEKIDKPKKPRVSLRQKIKITPEIKTKIEDAVVKTFGTRLPQADSPKFKKALTDAYKTLLFKDIKNMMGTKDTYESFLRDNFETIIEAIPQSVINKRFAPFFTRVEGKDGKQAREDTGQGNAVFEKKKIVKAQFISYFLGRDVKDSTKGTRKDALAETLAMEFAKDATPQTIKRADVVEKMKLANPTITQEKVSKAIDRPSDFAFSKKQIEGLRLFQAKDIFESTDDDLAQNDKQWKSLSKIYGFGAIDLKTEEGRKELLDGLITSGTAAQLPEVFWEGYYHYKYQSNNFFATSGEAKAWVKQAREGKIKDKEGNFLPKVKFAKATPEMKAMLKRESYVETVKGNKQNKLAKALNDPAFVKRQDQSLEGLKQVFDIFQNLIQENAETNIPLIIGMLSSTSSNMNHFIRTSSPVRFYEKSFTGDTSVFTEEHTLPASLVAKYLFIEATQNNINKVWPNVKRNFFQGALSNNNDNKLVGIGVNGEKYTYKSQTPPGWTMDDNIWGRYFNPNVANNNFGISPNEIMLGKGKSVYDSYSVNSSGDLISRGMVNSIADASSKNRNMLPKSVQPLKGVTNNEVLSEMQSLDNQANEARTAFSKGKDLNKDFNEIIEKATGIGQEKQYGKTKARAVAADKGKWDWAGIPPSAQDFVGLTRYFAGKGKKGDETIAWIKENFLDPFARANIDISNARVALANDFKGLKKLLNISPKDLNKKIPGEPYTIGNAIRVYTWTQQGMTVPGLSNADAKILNDLVEADSNLVTFANQLININKDNGYPKPSEGWLAGTITTDLLSGLNTVVRAKYLKQWQNNVNEVFTEANMNKLEAAYGSGYRDALENMLGRMKTGSNRGFKGDTLTGRFVDWLNGSIGAIMFFNMRSAVLQTISAVNFVNWSDNNPLKAAAAFGNQPQYWGDVVMLMNSDYLVERRNGLKININEADIAEIAAESKNKAKAFINKILKLGFLPTQIADSFAIASGGATFYRNRVKSLKKEGMSQKEAEAQAFQDFREVAEESQQSSRPDRISKQQAGPMGRVILAFANTPAQYARLMQKAASDLKNRRGDDKTNISKIIYYGAIQNVIFNALQQALFAMAFGDEEPDEEKKNKKYTGIVNGMADSLLRGIGFHGAAISTLKNVVMKLASGAKAQDAAIEMLDISPPVSSKIGKLRSAGRTWDWNKKEIMEKGWSLDNPAWLASGQVVSAATNIPLDRGIRKLQNLKDASDAENEEWMRVANALGWAKWELEWQKDKKSKSKKMNTNLSRKSVNRKSVIRKSVNRKSVKRN